MALSTKPSRFVKIMMWFMYLNPSTRIMISFFFMMMITMLIFSTMAYLDTWKFSYSFLPIAITMSAIIAIYSEWDMRKIRLIDEQTQKIIEQGLKTVVTVQISIGDSEYDEMFTYYLSVPNKLGKNWIFKLDIHASQGSQLAEGEYSAEIYFSQGVESPTLIFIEQHVILLGSPETKEPPPRRLSPQAELIKDACLNAFLGIIFTLIGLAISAALLSDYLAGNTSPLVGSPEDARYLPIFAPFMIFIGISLLFPNSIILLKIIWGWMKRDKNNHL